MSHICVIASGSHVILQIILALCLSKSKILCQGNCHKIDLCSQKKKKIMSEGPNTVALNYMTNCT